MTATNLRFAVRIALFSALAAASVGCREKEDAATRALKSAGGLSESQWPKGLRGDTPAPTGAIKADKSLEAGWYKNAKAGEKPPSAGDRPSMLRFQRRGYGLNDFNAKAGSPDQDFVAGNQAQR